MSEHETIREATTVFIGCAEDYMAAVEGLSKIKRGKTLFELSPILDADAYDGWIRLNDTGRRLRECIDVLKKLQSPLDNKGDQDAKS